MFVTTLEPELAKKLIACAHKKEIEVLADRKKPIAALALLKPVDRASMPRAFRLFPRVPRVPCG
ncbi:MAG: hypothetical protein HY706_19700 [Candidatus Hydrogenedentes bacterium]|nr:hypothetical protein [Candidatus Hydrogenedentota bacterium]